MFVDCSDLHPVIILIFRYIHLQELAITSDEALSLEELPKRAVILGGGYGSRCTLYHNTPSFPKYKMF
jgi:hypothetical protein